MVPALKERAAAVIPPILGVLEFLPIVSFDFFHVGVGANVTFRFFETALLAFVLEFLAPANVGGLSSGESSAEVSLAVSL